MKRQPQQITGSQFTVKGTATFHPGGTLVALDGCEAYLPILYGAGYADRSEAIALKRFKLLLTEAYGSQNFVANNVISAIVSLEGRFERNQNYRVTSDGRSRIMMTWDAAYEYVFVVTRILSVSYPGQTD